jgi:tetratricopeptide (TPR) repeat protein
MSMNNPPASFQAAETATLLAHLHSMRPAQGLSDDSIELVYAMAYNWLDKGEYDKARAGFEILCRQCPDVAAYHAGLAHAALNQDDAEAAMGHFLLAIELAPENAGYMVGLGRAFRLFNLPGHARMAFEMAQVMGQDSDPGAASMAKVCLAMMGSAA